MLSVAKSPGNQSEAEIRTLNEWLSSISHTVRRVALLRGEVKLQCQRCSERDYDNARDKVHETVLDLGLVFPLLSDTKHYRQDKTAY